ncbi:MAG: hypothetical protein MJ131_06040 [Lachnospiraceae bacterium]|nr:hypothetical protein [Lachnospiraceae bacterium]
MENNGQEISLIQLLKVAFGNKVRLIVITLLVAIIGALFFKLYYDPNKSEYVADFNYFVQGLDEGLYIDGSAFNYQELVSYDALAEAKASDADFANIDIDTMFNGNGISVKHVKDDKITNATVYLYYEITVKSRFFKDGNQAKAFISYLAEAPIAKTVQLSDSDKYKYNLKVFEDCESFDTQLKYLGDQLALLDGKYAQLIEYYGDIKLKDQDTITDKLNAMDVYFVNNSLSYLRYEKEENGYVLNKGRNIENLKLTMMDLDKQKKYNEMELERLEGSIVSLMGNVSSGMQSAEIDSYNSRITELIAKNVEITRKIDDIDLQLKNVDNAANTEYAKKLVEANGILDEYTDKYQQVEYEVVRDNSKVFYNNGSKIAGQGGMGLVKGGIIALVLGGFLACCVNLIMDWRKIFEDPFKEEKKKNEKATK